MSEYIECRNCDSPYCNGCNVYTLSKMLHKGSFKRITDDHHSIIPVADVVAVKHGRWETDKEDIEWGNALKRKYCTNCKKRPHFDKEERKFILTNYCPNCGADMRGADNG